MLLALAAVVRPPTRCSAYSSGDSPALFRPQMLSLEFKTAEKSGHKRRNLRSHAQLLQAPDHQTPDSIYGSDFIVMFVGTTESVFFNDSWILRGSRPQKNGITVRGGGRMGGTNTEMEMSVATSDLSSILQFGHFE